MSEVVLRPVDYAMAEVAELEREVQAEYARRYGSGDDTVLHPEQFRPPNGLFLLLTVDGVPAGMGGWRARDSDGRFVLDGDAEVKRMYVVPQLQRQGHARRLLAELERTAAQHGRTRMILETGTAQPEAIALYTSAGYTAMDRFGMYAHEESARYYAKVLCR